MQRQLVQMPVPRQRADLAAQVLQRAHYEDRVKILWRSVRAATVAAAAWASWLMWPRPVELALVFTEEPVVEIAAMSDATSAEKSLATQQAATYLLANKAEPDALAILLQEL